MRRSLRWLFIIAGLVAWFMAIGRAMVVFAIASQERRDMWLLDWHVYAAGAGDLVNRSLYRSPLEYPGWPLPVEQFNLPPMAAVWALPLAWLPGELGGVLWIAIGLGLWMWAWWLLVTRLICLPYPWVFMGLALAVYSRFVAFDIHLAVGNINDLMLGLVAGFVLLHLRGHQRAGGVVLGLAIATKLWPVVLGVVLFREQRWRELAWAGTVAAAGLLVPLAWLGPESVGPMIQALQTTVEVAARNPVLWTTWLRESFTWWPAAATVIIAALLLVIPARGHLGLGLAIVAGLTLIPNLWGHYLPTLLFGALLVFAEVHRRWSRRPEPLVP